MRPKTIRIKRGDSLDLPTVLGLHILRLYRRGYTRFDIEVDEEKKEVVLKALRVRKNG